MVATDIEEAIKQSEALKGARCVAVVAKDSMSMPSLESVMDAVKSPKMLLLTTENDYSSVRTSMRLWDNRTAPYIVAFLSEGALKVRIQ